MVQLPKIDIFNSEGSKSSVIHALSFPHIPENVSNKKKSKNLGARKRAQQVKVFAVKPGDLHSPPKTDMVEERMNDHSIYHQEARYTESHLCWTSKTSP